MSKFIIAGSFTKPETTDEQSVAEALSMGSRFQQALFDAYEVEKTGKGYVIARKTPWGMAYGDAGPITISYKFSGSPREIGYSVQVEHKLPGYVSPLFTVLLILLGISDSVLRFKDWPTWLQYVAWFAYAAAGWGVVLPVAEFIWNAITSKHRETITGVLQSAFALRNSFDHQEISFALMKKIHAKCWADPKRYPKYVDAFKLEIGDDFLLHDDATIYSALHNMAQSIKLVPAPPSSESDDSANFTAELKWCWGLEKACFTVLHKPGIPCEITDITLISHVTWAEAHGKTSVGESNPESVKPVTITGDENSERITPLPRQVLEEKTIRASYFGKDKRRIGLITEWYKDNVKRFGIIALGAFAGALLVSWVCYWIAEVPWHWIGYLTMVIVGGTIAALFAATRADDTLPSRIWAMGKIVLVTVLFAWCFFIWQSYIGHNWDFADSITPSGIADGLEHKRQSLDLYRRIKETEFFIKYPVPKASRKYFNPARGMESGDDYSNRLIWYAVLLFASSFVTGLGMCKLIPEPVVRILVKFCEDDKKNKNDAMQSDKTQNGETMQSAPEREDQNPQRDKKPSIYERFVAALIIATGALALIAGIILLVVLLCKENNPPKMGHMVAMSIIAGGGGIGYGVKGWKDKDFWDSTLGKILKFAVPLFWTMPLIGFLLSRL